ncbi:MAG: hypothetical protein H6712_31955 [Myxococcales bacterium]|nr:hypothetical protein [Myxococcales bacterium]MCB9718508.1 hypothetical protein [Myxococcales bacterium]
MRALLAASLPIVLGCRSPAPAPSSPAPAGADDPAFDSGDLPWPSPAACEAAAEGPAPDAAVVEELGLVVGGLFAVDHLGPERFESIKAHVRDEPDAFLDAWAQAALAPDAAVDAYWANLLERTAVTRRDRSRLLAGCLVLRLDAALAHPPAGADASWADRVADHHRSLYLVWREPVLGESRRLAQPATATLDASTQVLRVEDSCTCGEPLECTVAAGPERLDALLTLDLSAPAACRDCFPGTTTCRLPAELRDRAVTVNGRSISALSSE